MRWDRGYQSNDVDDRRGEGPVGGGFGGGGLGGLGSLLLLGGRFGWKGILFVLLVIGAISYGPRMCSTSGSPDSAPSRVSSDQAPEDQVSFVGFVLDDVQKTFAREVPGYQRTRLELFRDSIQSACGTATAAVGPFYCPLDKKVYIDLAFYDDLRERFGAPGDFAQAYVVAHEVGHHVQNQRGLLGRGEVDQIHIELQADCLAGAWAKDAQARGLVEVGDIDEALNAAAQIGDDTLQRKATGHVQPEKWTHGSAAQRSGSFKRGFTDGVAGCGL